jgi:hypothetical protein
MCPQVNVILFFLGFVFCSQSECGLYHKPQDSPISQLEHTSTTSTRYPHNSLATSPSQDSHRTPSNPHINSLWPLKVTAVRQVISAGETWAKEAAAVSTRIFSLLWRRRRRPRRRYALLLITLSHICNIANICIAEEVAWRA